MWECLPVCGLPGITANTFLNYLNHRWHNSHFCSHLLFGEHQILGSPYLLSQSNLLWSKALFFPICGTRLGLVLKSKCVATYWQTLSTWWLLTVEPLPGDFQRVWWPWHPTERWQAGEINDANKAKGRLISWWQSDHDRVCSLTDAKGLSKSRPGDCY